MGKQSKQQQYVSILSQIKQTLDSLDENRSEVFEQLKVILQILDKEHINIDEMCRNSGDSQAYYHNKYLMGVFYLTLGECYDFDLNPDFADDNLAKKYYMLSDQPASKWRLAKLYLAKKLRYDGDVNIIAHRLISEAIDSLIGELYNQRYFGKRLEYLVVMYEDLIHLTLNTRQKEIHDLYFDILQWIINNRSNVHSEHLDTLNQLLTFDVPCQTPREINLMKSVSQLTGDI